MSLKKKYIKQAYIEEAYCDKCGSILQPTGIALMSYPVQYPYQCTNPDCDFTQTINGDDRPGTLKYDYEEDLKENDNV